MAQWQQSIPREKLRFRARLLEKIRAFMAELDIMEVETPVLDISGNTDPAIWSLTTTVDLPATPQQQLFYLHSSPEFAMKRLLATGSGSIYQICKVFRNDESGRLHQPEFTMLEWYRPGFDHHELMDEVASLLLTLELGSTERITYADLFYKYFGMNPHNAELTELQEMSHNLGLNSVKQNRSTLLDFLFSHGISPDLGIEHPLFVYDYPLCQAALARLRKEKETVAERFELFIHGIEIANGFNELCDPHEQQHRFEQENITRRRKGLAEVRIDDKLIAALQHGLPECAGVAVGLDRLLMVLTDSKDIQDVLALPISVVYP